MVNLYCYQRKQIKLQGSCPQLLIWQHLLCLKLVAFKVQVRLTKLSLMVRQHLKETMKDMWWWKFVYDPGPRYRIYCINTQIVVVMITSNDVLLIWPYNYETYEMFVDTCISGHRPPSVQWSVFELKDTPSGPRSGQQRRPRSRSEGMTSLVSSASALFRASAQTISWTTTQ